MKKHKVYLKDIMSEHPEIDYSQLYAYVMGLIECKKLTPVKSAKTNGKKPALPLSFWKEEEETDYTEVYEELKYQYHPLLNMSYYSAHPERYEADREKLKHLSNYLKDHSDLLQVEESMNERSFEIFHREKYFQREGGLEFCRRVGIEQEKLSFYGTSEPLSYYSHSKQTPQNILIVENKDTFFDIRRYLNKGNSCILGVEFGTVIYGAGKGIWKTFADYVNGAETYFLGNNAIFYFGDLDYEGIFIYEHLTAQGGMAAQDATVVEDEQPETNRKINIHIFREAYEKMLDKALKIGLENLPDTKENQNTNIGTKFLEAFDERRRRQICELLEAGKYIPQEILNEHDW